MVLAKRKEVKYSALAGAPNEAVITTGRRYIQA